MERFDIIMDQSIPVYLIALAVGDLQSADLSVPMSPPPLSDLLLSLSFFLDFSSSFSRSLYCV